MPNYAASSPNQPIFAIFKGTAAYSFGAKTPAAIAASPSGLVRSVVAGQVQVALTTNAAHNFQVGGLLVVSGSTSVLGSLFDGNYIIAAIPSGTTATLIPIDATLIHQKVDTGGAGNATAIAFEQPAAPQAGQAFSLGQMPLSDNPAGFSVDGQFSAAPGVFEIDVQVSEVDVDVQYQTILNGNITAVDATNQTFHFDAPSAGAKFARILLKARTNAVGLVATIRR